jgi:hypothetical protein
VYYRILFKKYISFYLSISLSIVFCAGEERPGTPGKEVEDKPGGESVAGRGVALYAG